MTQRRGAVPIRPGGHLGRQLRTVCFQIRAFMNKGVGTSVFPLPSLSGMSFWAKSFQGMNFLPQLHCGPNRPLGIGEGEKELDPPNQLIDL